ncbi:tripartite tricarboxylate transporter substrate binding protein [Thalassospira sp. NFXS8]|uniref:Bug family tripartite tricarboxylate transporter substrate binding protein n=1 Tax=Thalassospira sp. NFXS8 TaxID=2819093 RepID=UPI0032DF4979
MTFAKLIKGALAGAVALSFAGVAQADDFPSRGIEFVAGYGPGGGHDTMLRAMAKIIQNNDLSEVPINVVNKPGGSSAVALGYLNSHKGDGHFLMSATSSFITTPLTSNIGLDYTNFTPIARLGVDPELLVVNASGPYKTLDDIAKAAKVLNVGGTGTGTIENIVTIKLAEALGKKLNYIPFQGDGEVVSALLSNQVDFTITNTGPVGDFIKTGRFNALAISTEKRVELFPDVPTFIEQGYDINLSLFRGVVAAGDIGDTEKAYLLKMVKAMSETKEWQENYIQPNSVVPDFLGPDEFAEYLKGMNDVYKASLTNLGIIK